MKSRIMKAAELQRRLCADLNDMNHREGEKFENARLRPLIEALADVVKAAKIWKCETSDYQGNKHWGALSEALAALEKELEK